MMAFLLWVKNSVDCPHAFVRIELMQVESSSEEHKVRWGSFWSLVLIQAMNSLNEKGVQFLLVALGIWLMDEAQYVLSILIVLPFVLFSPLSGWLSDSYCKTRVLQSMVLLQVLVLIGMTVGFFTHQLWLAMGSFTVFCVQATLFSPAKKGLVKDMVGTKNIGFASGVLEVSSMLALLVGQIGALFIVYYLLSLWGDDYGWEAAAWPTLFCCGSALLVFFLSLSIPRYEPKGKREFSWRLLWQHFIQIRSLLENKILLRCQVGIGFFWFLGGTMMLLVLQIAGDANEMTLQERDFMSVLGQQKDSALLLAWLSLGSIMGGLTAAVLCAKRIRMWVTHWGGVFLVIGCFVLACCDMNDVAFLPALVLCGFMASGFLVPLNARLQDSAAEDRRGDVIAASNLVDCFLGMMAVLLQKSLNLLGASTQMQCAILGMLSLIVTVYLWRNMRH